MLKDKRKFGSIVCLSIGAFLVIIGIIIIAILPVVVKSQVKKTVPLTKTGTTGETWVDPPYEVTMYFYIFNVSNPDEIVMAGAKPSLVQHGPYIYREFQHKRDIHWSQDGTWVEYQNVKTYQWAEDLTKQACPTCSENDLFVVPNVPLLSIVQLLSAKASKDVVEAAGWLLVAFGQRPFSQPKPARQLIFEGYPNFLLNLTSNPTVRDILKALNLPSGLPDKMGFFYGKNATDDGRYNISTGTVNPAEVGKIIDWKNATSLPKHWWTSDLARELLGTDGTLYPPFLKRSDQPHLFVSDICRSLYLTYYKDINIKGIPGYRFVVPAEVFDSTIPQNRGYCTNSIMSNVTYYSNSTQTIYGCLPSGMLDISQCQPGNPPIVVTSPHFLFCPDEVVHSVGGVFPNLEQMQTSIDLEPTTGIGLKFQRKLQLNVPLVQYKNILQFENIKNVIIPVMWLNESATINEATVDLLKRQVINMQIIVYAMAYVILGIGLISAVGVLVAFLVFRKKQDELQQTLHNPIYTSNPSINSSVSVTPQIMRHQPVMRFQVATNGTAAELEEPVVKIVEPVVQNVPVPPQRKVQAGTSSTSSSSSNDESY